MDDNDRMPLPRRILLGLVLIVIGIVYGFYATRNHWKAADWIFEIDLAFRTVFEQFERDWYLSFPPSETQVETLDASSLEPGLVLVAGISDVDNNFIRIIDRDGNVVQQWLPDWFKIWPEPPEGVPASRVPQENPGAILHGVEITSNGDVIFNYEFLSTIRLDACGNVVWKSPNMGHHSVFLAEDGTIWVGSERFVGGGETGYPNVASPLNSWAVMQMDADGNILQTKEILEILQENDLLGLMLMSSLDNAEPVVKYDTLHLNDIEVYPSNMPSEIFAPGDLLISLRNISTVIVVDPKTWKIKYRSTGEVLRQHDADFIGDDKIIVYDNRNLDPMPREDLYSRVAILDARTGTHDTYFKGEGKAHYYSPTMGRQALLPNGNLMVISPHEGRVIEVDKQGNLLWQYYNVLDAEYTGLVTEGYVLPPELDAAFFAEKRAACGQ